MDAQGESVTEALPEADKNDLPKHLTEGRRVFSESGCLACHVHDGVRQKGRRRRAGRERRRGRRSPPT